MDIQCCVVKKVSRKWKVCVNYSYLNWACPKDTYPIINIDKLMDSLDGYKFLSFLDVYSNYDPIPMFKVDRDKSTPKTERANYRYDVMPFNLKSARSKYQRMVNKIFMDEISRKIRIYMDVMIVKFNNKDMHDKTLSQHVSDST